MPVTIVPVMISVAGASFVRVLTSGYGIRLYGSSSGYVGLKPATAAGSTDYTLPSSPPSADGQVLIGTTAGVLSWATVATNPAGVGTELQYRNGSSFGATGIHWDAVNSRVGFGTSSPGRQVTIYDASISILQFATAFTGTGGGRGGLVYHNGSHLVFENQESAGTTKFQATAATQVPATISLASGQSANALEINSYGGSGGDKFKVTADGHVYTNVIAPTTQGFVFIGYYPSSRGMAIDASGFYFKHIASGGFRWAETDNVNSSTDTGLYRNAAGVVEVNNGTAGTYRDLKLRHLVATGQAYCPQQTLTDAASISWDLDTQPSAVVTLADNRTLAAPTNQKAGATYILVVKQDATGSRTLTFNAVYKFAGGTAPTLTTTANAVDILTFISDGTYMYGVCQNDLR